MILRKRVIIGFCALLTISTASIVGFIMNNTRPHRALDSFARMVESGNLDDVRLRIYFIEPGAIILPPLSLDELIAFPSSGFTIESNRLAEHMDLLRHINSELLVSSNDSHSMDTRIHLIFETTEGSRLFDVTMWARPYRRMLVNGHLFEEIQIFYDILMRFLPEHESNLLRRFIEDGGL